MADRYEATRTPGMLSMAALALGLALTPATRADSLFGQGPAAPQRPAVELAPTEAPSAYEGLGKDEVRTLLDVIGYMIAGDGLVTATEEAFDGGLRAELGPEWQHYASYSVEVDDHGQRVEGGRVWLGTRTHALVKHLGELSGEARSVVRQRLDEVVALEDNANSNLWQQRNAAAIRAELDRPSAEEGKR